jgi:hypothetical protein
MGRKCRGEEDKNSEVRTDVGVLQLSAHGESVLHAGKDLNLVLRFLFDEDVLRTAAELGGEGEVALYMKRHLRGRWDAKLADLRKTSIADLWSK